MKQNTNKNKFSDKALFSFFLMLGIGLNLGAIYSYFVTQNFLATASRAKGEVVDVSKQEDFVRYEKTDKHGHTKTVTTNQKVAVYCPTISFETSKKQEIQFKVACDADNNYKQWMTVEVLYDPHSPLKSAVINDFFPLWKLTIGLLGFAWIPLVFCLIALAKSSKLATEQLIQSDNNRGLLKKIILISLVSPYIIISITLIKEHQTSLLNLLPETKVDYLNDSSLSQMQRLYLNKIHSDEYLVWDKLKFRQKTYQSFESEQQIKDYRAQLLSSVQVAQGESIHHIPRASVSPIIDGKMSSKEWENSFKLLAYPKENATELYFIADENWLYIAIDMPKEKIAANSAYIQLQFHPNMIPELVSESLLFKGKDGLQGIKNIKGSRLMQGIYKNNKPSTKNKYFNDSHIFKNMIGASSITPHRQYELRLSRQELGIQANIPFTLQVNIIGAPKSGTLAKPGHRLYFKIE